MRRVKIKSAQFVTSSPNLAGCPPSHRPEFAFIGRSNVGKSSLINLLAQRRDLAMVSATPGKTRLINFFAINETWTLVDLPGYGFAKVAQGQRADFNEAVADFLEHRENLAHVFVLIDSMLPPQRIDLAFLGWLAGTEADFSLVFTKTDRQPSKVAGNIAAFKAALVESGVAPSEHVFQVSAHAGDGRGELLNFIDALVRGKAPPAPTAPAPKSTAPPARTAAEKPARPARASDDYVDPNDWDKIS